ASLRDFRSYAKLELGLEPGLVLVTGPNGAGKTNLLASLHVGTQGFSPRTRADAQLVRFGRDAARIALRGERAGAPVELEVTLELGSGKRASLNGARLRAAEQLGMPEAMLGYDAEPPSVEVLEARTERDLERGATGLGPHLDDIAVLSGDRDLRAFGSQGEQRLAVLALLLGEAELLEERRGVRPLLLLDDVLSELDPERRRVLADRLRAGGQALVTSASANALPGEPAQTITVAQGRDG